MTLVRVYLVKKFWKTEILHRRRKKRQMFKDENKFRRRRKEIYVFLNFDLKNVDFGAKFN